MDKIVGVYINAESEVRTVMSRGQSLVSINLKSKTEIPVSIKQNSVSELGNDQGQMFETGEFTLYPNNEALFQALKF